jgi:hypothetical protein
VRQAAFHAQGQRRYPQPSEEVSDVDGSLSSAGKPNRRRRASRLGAPGRACFFSRMSSIAMTTMSLNRHRASAASRRTARWMVASRRGNCRGVNFLVRFLCWPATARTPSRSCSRSRSSHYVRGYLAHRFTHGIEEGPTSVLH